MHNDEFRPKEIVLDYETYDRMLKKVNEATALLKDVVENKTHSMLVARVDGRYEMRVITNEEVYKQFKDKVITWL